MSYYTSTRGDDAFDLLARAAIIIAKVDPNNPILIEIDDLFRPLLTTDCTQTEWANTCKEAAAD